MLIREFFKHFGRLFTALGLMLFTGGMACFSPIYAAGKTPPPAIQKQAEVDLNGSGKPVMRVVNLLKLLKLRLMMVVSSMGWLSPSKG